MFPTLATVFSAHALVIVALVAAALLIGKAATQGMISYKGQSQILAETNNLINKTGGASVLGAVYAQDILQSNAASVDYATGLLNVVGVTTANLTKAPLVVCGKGGVADAGLIPVEMEGIIDVLVNGTVALGDSLVPVNAQTYLQAQGGTTRACAIALEVHSGAATTIKAWFKGYPSGKQ